MDEKKPRIFAMSFGSVYPLYLQKVAKKGRTQDELDDVITWLTGYTRAQLPRVMALDFEAFFAQAPKLHKNARLITGVVCGVRVEDLTDPLMQKIRWLDKLVDELANGRAMERILRDGTAPSTTTSATTSTRTATPTATAKKAPAKKAPAKKAPAKKAPAKKAPAKKAPAKKAPAKKAPAKKAPAKKAPAKSRKGS